MTSRLAEILPPYHRRGNRVFSAANRWPDFWEKKEKGVIEGKRGHCEFSKTDIPFTDLAGRAERRLAVLDAAPALDALAALPSNRLETLSGDRVGQYSIRVNEQWRICFKWRDGDAFDVEIVDYHR